MAKLLITLSILLTVGIIGTNTFKLTQHVEVEVATSEKMQDILKQYPNAVKVTHETFKQLSKSETDEESRNIKVTLGARVHGDLEVGKESESYSWDTPQDYQTTMSYSSSGDDKILSCVNLYMTLSNLNHTLHIVSGGIGQRHIKLLLEAFNTEILEYDASFYGY